MRGGIVVTWGAPHPSREVQASAISEKFRTYLSTLAKKGVVDDVTELASLQGSSRNFTGISVISGELGQLQTLQTEPTYQQHLLAMESSFRGVTAEFCIGGDEASLQAHETIREKAWQEAGYL